MPTVRIVIEIEAGEALQTSVKLEQPKPTANTVVTETPIQDKVHHFLETLGRNEEIVLKAVLQAATRGEKVYRRQVMSQIGFDQLLQFNGVLAWLTRKYDKSVGGWLVETAYDQQVDDYNLRIRPGTAEDVLNALKAGITS